jgi:flagellin
METTGIGLNTALSGLQSTNKALQKILERLSTAKRINSASDDAAGLSISEQLLSQARGFQTATQNVSDAMNALNIGDAATGQISDLLQRNRDLALQANNGTLNDTQRKAINVEFQQNLQEIDRTANSTQFNGQNLINGAGLGSGTSLIQAGPNGGDMMQLPHINLGVNPLGLGGANVATAGGASAAINSLDNAMKTLNTARSTIGATVNRLSSSLNNMSVAQINTTAAQSQISDMDMAEGMTSLTTQQLLQETGMYAFKRFNEINANHIMALLQ